MMQNRVASLLIFMLFFLSAFFHGSLRSETSNKDAEIHHEFVPGNYSLRLATFVSSHMVLQREPSKARIWGWAAPGSTVQASILNTNTSSPNEYVVVTVQAIADRVEGSWSIHFPPQQPGADYEIHVSDGRRTVILEDIAFGDVFLCSGQSNMEMTVGAAFDAKKEIEDSIHYPNLRLATVKKKLSDVEMYDADSATYYVWARSSPSAVTGGRFDTGWGSAFSATCYFFGRDLYKSMDGNIPIGLVVSCWGAQPIEAFSSPAALEDETCGGTNHNEFEHPWNKSQRPVDPFYRSEPAQLWNAMIHPLLPMRFVGVVWYQGEANALDPVSYACRFPAMISDWRRRFQAAEDLIFLYVELAGYPPGESWPWLRAAQRAALQLPGVGMATAVDLGDKARIPHGQQIHPRRKQEVGRRLMLVMKALRYQEPQARADYEGPELDRVDPGQCPSESESSNLCDTTLSFRVGDIVGGLHFAGSADCKSCCKQPPFVVLDAHGNWTRAASTTILDETKIFLTYKINTPILGIRYAWDPRPECILYNDIGLPAVPWEWCATPRRDRGAHWYPDSCLVP